MPWTSAKKPKRLLVIRLNAFGDILITFPYINSLKKQLGEEVEIDFLGMDLSSPLIESLGIYKNVYRAGKKLTERNRRIYSILCLPRLYLRRYDAVIDLQKSFTSKLVRAFLGKKPFVEFDKFGPRPAGERYQNTINALNIAKVSLDHSFSLSDQGNIDAILKESGWDGNKALVILNPAGSFPSRNWPTDNYIEFARLYLKEISHDVQFVFVGVEKISGKADYITSALGQSAVNVVGRTSILEAYASIKRSRFVLSEDGALMHAAWTVGTPVVALLGSTRADWTQPLSKNSAFFASSDLPCGDCMQEICTFGDNRCLTRVTPSMVIGKAKSLL